jgi:acyl carrier protein
MVPGGWVELEALPRLPNGKLDRRALPAAEPGAQAEYVAPRGEVEELLCGIWLEVLSSPAAPLERVGIHDNFFDLGGHSLLATRVAARIRQALGIDVPLRVLFQLPTVAELAGPVEDQLIAGLEASDLEERLARLEEADDPDLDR